MSNEEFQRIVLEKLGSLEAKVDNIETKVVGLEDKVGNVELKLVGLEGRMENVEKELEELNKAVDAIYEQTADLTEFKSETIFKLDEIMENNKSFYEIIGEHEVAIRNLRRISI